MFSVCVEAGFRGIHHVRFADGTTETPHAHDWKVRVTVRRPRLDEAGMVVDFERVHGALAAVLAPFDQTDLNAHLALHGLNPTAEVVAQIIFNRLVESGVRDLHRVEVTEAPGCVAAFEVG